MSLFESLESRVLMSVTPAQSSSALKAFKTAEAAIRADLTGLGKQLVGDQKTINSALGALGTAKSQASLTKNAFGAATGIVTSLNKLLKGYTGSINKLSSKLVADEAKLAKKPTSASLAKLVNNDIASLTLNASKGEVAFSNGANGGSIFTAFISIAIANPTSSSLSSSINTITMNIATSLNTTRIDAGVLFINDVTALENLYAG